jgi:4-hydroxy-tetrahydrodipicolinate synthase
MIFSGAISTPLTPFDSNEKISPGLIDEHINWEAEHGVHGLFVLGTWGAFPLLSFEERKSIAKEYITAANRYGIGSIIQIGSPCLHESIELIHQAHDHGATAIAAVIPYYHSSAGYYSFDHYRKYFERILKESELPLFVYNNRRTTGVLLSPREFVTLVEDGFHGVKDGSKDVGWIMSAQQLLGEKKLDAEIIPGNTTAILYSHVYGLKSVTSGAAVTFPRLIADIYKKLEENDIPGAASLHALLMNSRRAISRYGNPAMISYALLEVMKAPGLGLPRLPWNTIEQNEALRLLSDLRSIPGLNEYLT